MWWKHRGPGRRANPRAVDQRRQTPKCSDALNVFEARFAGLQGASLRGMQSARIRRLRSAAAGSSGLETFKVLVPASLQAKGRELRMLRQAATR